MTTVEAPAVVGDPNNPFPAHLPVIRAGSPEFAALVGMTTGIR